MGTGDVRRVRYAVIEAIYDTTHSERLVVPYATRKSLKEVIAGPRILAYGFECWDEAALFASRPKPRSFGLPVPLTCRVRVAQICLAKMFFVLARHCGFLSACLRMGHCGGLPTEAQMRAQRS